MTIVTVKATLRAVLVNLCPFVRRYHGEQANMPLATQVEGLESITE